MRNKRRGKKKPIPKKFLGWLLFNLIITFILSSLISPKSPETYLFFWILLNCTYIYIFIIRKNTSEINENIPYQEYSTHSEYINSDEWKNRSYNFKLKANGQCYLCGKYVGISNLESHHKKYPKNFKYDNEDNLIAICRICHAKIHGTENPFE